jgi:hypothetical protein
VKTFDLHGLADLLCVPSFGVDAFRDYQQIMRVDFSLDLQESRIVASPVGTLPIRFQIIGLNKNENRSNEALACQSYLIYVLATSWHRCQVAEGRDLVEHGLILSGEVG